MHSVEIVSERDGRGSVTIDGHDISHLVMADGVRVYTGANQVPKVELTLGIGRVVQHIRAAHVEVDRDTGDLLRTLGWIPPRG